MLEETSTSLSLHYLLIHWEKGKAGSVVVARSSLEGKQQHGAGFGVVYI